MTTSESASAVSNLPEFAASVQSEVASGSERSARSALGQFFTPAEVARLLASLSKGSGGHLRILDAGAGVGTLTASLVACVIEGDEAPEAIEVVAIEVDDRLTDA